MYFPTYHTTPSYPHNQFQTQLSNVNAVVRAAHDRVKPAGPLPPAATTSIVAMFALRSVWQHYRLQHSLRRESEPFLLTKLSSVSCRRH